ncbi:MAG: hypothetical protein ACK450_01475 [Sphingomonadales bacterium]
MNKKLLLIAPLSMLALAACSKSETPAADADATKTADASAAPVKMPPPITAQETYRCADNTIVHIDFLGANEAADIRVGDKTAVAIRVSPEVEAAAAPADATAPAADEAKPVGPLKSVDGETVLTGSGQQINLKLAGKGAQNCKG